MTRKFLDSVYDHIGAEVGQFYDNWAATYDAEVGENGYVTPGRCAKALAGCVPSLDAPVLDFGCGTGLSGLALRAQGFSTLDGMDLSAEMLAQAQAKGIYRTLTQVSAGAEIPVDDQDYSAIAAIGVIGPGAAPIETFDTLVGLLSQGGHMVLSFNDHALEDPAYEAHLKASQDKDTLKLCFEEHGPHLPTRNINSTVYVFEKL